jgi:predicted metal-binding membrane protein
VTSDHALESVVRRERAVTLTALVVLAALAWASVVLSTGRGVDSMADMPGMAMGATAWGARDVSVAAAMWAVMMVAMMLPSAAPMILMFATVNRRRLEGGQAPYVPTGLFALAYLCVWTAFSILAALGEWALRATALLPGATLTPLAGGLVLIAAGIYQLTPLKYACLSRCRTPLGFLMGSWREGRAGAFAMGVRHGVFCVGCCWLLMALLFVSGMMNPAWIALIAGFVLIEKVLPHGKLVSWTAGVVLIACGSWMLTGALRG